MPWKITEVYHTEVEYFNEAELKRMAENLCKLMDNYLKNKEREEIHICLWFMEDLICVKDRILFYIRIVIVLNSGILYLTTKNPPFPVYS